MHNRLGTGVGECVVVQIITLLTMQQQVNAAVEWISLARKSQLMNRFQRKCGHSNFVVGFQLVIRTRQNRSSLPTVPLFRHLGNTKLI